MLISWSAIWISFREEGFDTGPVAAGVFRLILAGFPVEEATAQVHRTSGGQTAGCNPAHRASPLAMAEFLVDEDVAQFAAQEAALTHWDPLQETLPQRWLYFVVL